MTFPILFVDRDGTLVNEREPGDTSPLLPVPGVIPALLRFRDAGYRFVVVSNQPGLSTDARLQAEFATEQRYLERLFESQGVVFAEQLVCPHTAEAACSCRKPGLGLVAHWLTRTDWNRTASAVVGDRASDLQLAEQMGLPGLRIGDANGWPEIAHALLTRPRTGRVLRQTSETRIEVRVDLDPEGVPLCEIATGIGFFDHMLEQISRHGNIGLRVQVEGDLHIDDHHTIEDTGIALGTALAEALGDKRGIGRFGFYLPMDESSARVALDLSGRTYARFDGRFSRDAVGGLATEMVPHFFRSLAEGLRANLHITIEGENNHHLVEVAFKGFGRCLRDAVRRSDASGAVPSTKGVL